MTDAERARTRLLHIRDEIDGLETAIAGVPFDQYQQSYMLRRATERALQIISEAAKALPSELTTRHPEAPWKAIIGLGNILT